MNYGNSNSTNYLSDASSGLPVVVQEQLNGANTNYLYGLGSTSPLYLTDQWAVTETGQLVIVPETLKGVEIKHSVLTNGGPVLAAGRADIATSKGSYFGISIDNYSGHYQPSADTLQIGRDAFSKLGITFP